MRHVRGDQEGGAHCALDDTLAALYERKAPTLCGGKGGRKEWKRVHGWKRKRGNQMTDAWVCNVHGCSARVVTFPSATATRVMVSRITGPPAPCMRGGGGGGGSEGWRVHDGVVRVLRLSPLGFPLCPPLAPLSPLALSAHLTCARASLPPPMPHPHLCRVAADLLVIEQGDGAHARLLSQSALTRTGVNQGLRGSRGGGGSKRSKGEEREREGWRR